MLSVDENKLKLKEYQKEYREAHREEIKKKQHLKYTKKIKQELVNLTNHRKEWTKEEDLYLQENFIKKSLDALSRKLGRSYASIRQRVGTHLKLTGRKQFHKHDYISLAKAAKELQVVGVKGIKPLCKYLDIHIRTALSRGVKGVRYIDFESFELLEDFIKTHVTVTTFSKEVFMTRATVLNRIKSGRIIAKRVGVQMYYIPTSELKRIKGE